MDVSNFSIIVNMWGNEPPTVREIIDVAVEAERLGFHSVGLTHLPVLLRTEDEPPAHLGFIPPEFQYSYFDPMALLPLLAQATSRINIGFNIFTTGFLHPYVTTKYLASIDVLSNGRLLAGFGLGVARAPSKLCRSYTALGMDSRRRGRMADEALELIVRLWTEDAPLSADGDFFKADRLVVAPRPVQKPYPNIWWAGEGERSLARGARYGQYVQSVWASPESLRTRQVPRLQELNARYGGHAEMALCAYSQIMSENIDITDDELSEAFWGYPADSLQGAIAGSVRQCAEKIRAFREAGVSHFTLDLQRHGVDSVLIIRDQMQMFTELVLPYLSDLE